MALHVFLLVVCILLTLALLWCLDWFPRRPSSSWGEVKRSRMQRLLKPRSPDDCPCIGYLDHPFKNRPFETEKQILTLLANIVWSL